MKFLTVDEMVTTIGSEEILQVAGIGRERHEDGRRIDTDKVEEAIRFADDLVIAKISARYETVSTITPEQTPNLLKGYVADIARYRLRLRSANQNQVTDEVRNRYKDACAFLKDVQQGHASLNIAGDPRGSETRFFGVGDANPENRADEILAGY